MIHTRRTILEAKLDLLRPTLSAAGRRIIFRDDPAVHYPAYVATMHGISRAAVPLMQTAIQRLDAHSDEECAAPLRKYLAQHIPEETGHDEWALEDLETIGIDRQLVLGQLPSPSVAAMVGAQYYWIHHVHPVALMGYLAVVEANPPAPDTVRWLEHATGYPHDAFRSMRIHAKLDIQHREDVFQVIDSLPLDESLERLVTMSALHTTELLVQVLTELGDRCDAAERGVPDFNAGLAANEEPSIR